MSLQSLLAWALNSAPKPVPRPTAGIYVGDGRSLIGNEPGRVSIAPQPPQHTFVSGRTGSGKTTLLLKVMSEYHRVGIPFLFIDFHGQATDDLLALIAGRQG